MRMFVRTSARFGKSDINIASRQALGSGVRRVSAGKVMDAGVLTRADESRTLLKRSPRCWASHQRLLLMVMACSMASFCRKAGSAIIRPTSPRENCDMCGAGSAKASATLSKLC